MKPELNNIMKNLKPQSLSKEAIKQFQTVAKYLCFFASAAKVTIGEKVDEQASAIVQKFGTAENIKAWCLTPQQLSVFANSDGMPFVILTGGNGTGKSMVLKEVAKQKANQGIKVLYAIQWYAFVALPLLYFIIKKELEVYGIEVIMMNHREITR